MGKSRKSRGSAANAEPSGLMSIAETMRKGRPSQPGAKPKGEPKGEGKAKGRLSLAKERKADVMRRKDSLIKVASTLATSAWDNMVPSAWKSDPTEAINTNCLPAKFGKVCAPFHFLISP